MLYSVLVLSYNVKSQHIILHAYGACLWSGPKERGIS